jgi:hypothetical protein
MTKSKARRVLEEALDAATTTEQKADFASRLAWVIHIEGMERARKRRARAKKEATAKSAAAHEGQRKPTHEELALPFEMDASAPSR